MSSHGWRGVAMTDREWTLLSIAATCHQACDLYDAYMCTAISPYTGEPFPATGEEAGAIHAHARLQLEHAFQSGLAHGLSRQEVMTAIQQYVAR